MNRNPSKHSKVELMQWHVAVAHNRIETDDRIHIPTTTCNEVTSGEQRPSREIASSSVGVGAMYVLVESRYVGLSSCRPAWLHARMNS